MSIDRALIRSAALKSDPPHASTGWKAGGWESWALAMLEHPNDDDKAFFEACPPQAVIKLLDYLRLYERCCLAWSEHIDLFGENVLMSQKMKDMVALTREELGEDV